jgi:mRNA interferase MazF
MSMVMERVEMNKNINVATTQYEVWLADLQADGSVQGGRRPVVILSNNLQNKFSPTVMVAPTTGSKTKRPLPTHVDLIASEIGFVKDSVLLCEQTTSINKHRLIKKLIDLPYEYQSKIAEAIRVAFAEIKVY